MKAMAQSSSFCWPVGKPARLLVGEMPEPEEIDHAVRRRRQSGVALAEESRKTGALVLLSGEDQISRTVSSGKTCSSWKVRLRPAC